LHLVPEPAATRFLREAFSTLGFLRSSLVMDEMIACWRVSMLSSMLAAAICFFALPMPGSMPISAGHAAHLLHLVQAVRPGR
jgi:hypothetical protein